MVGAVQTTAIRLVTSQPSSNILSDIQALCEWSEHVSPILQDIHGEAADSTPATSKDDVKAVAPNGSNTAGCDNVTTSASPPTKTSDAAERSSTLSNNEQVAVAENSEAAAAAVPAPLSQVYPSPTEETVDIVSGPFAGQKLVLFANDESDDEDDTEQQRQHRKKAVPAEAVRSPLVQRKRPETDSEHSTKGTPSQPFPLGQDTPISENPSRATSKATNDLASPGLRPLDLSTALPSLPSQPASASLSSQSSQSQSQPPERPLVGNPFLSQLGGYISSSASQDSPAASQVTIPRPPPGRRKKQRDSQASIGLGLSPSQGIPLGQVTPSQDDSELSTRAVHDPTGLSQSQSFDFGSSISQTPPSKNYNVHAAPLASLNQPVLHPSQSTPRAGAVAPPSQDDAAEERPTDLAAQYARLQQLFQRDRSEWSSQSSSSVTDSDESPVATSTSTSTSTSTRKRKRVPQTINPSQIIDLVDDSSSNDGNHVKLLAKKTLTTPLQKRKSVTSTPQPNHTAQRVTSTESPRIPTALFLPDQSKSKRGKKKGGDLALSGLAKAQRLTAAAAASPPTVLFDMSFVLSYWEQQLKTHTQQRRPNRPSW